jgi:hypothetical protein
MMMRSDAERRKKERREYRVTAKFTHDIAYIEYELIWL